MGSGWLQDGPLAVTNGVITPKNSYKGKIQLPIYKAMYGGYNNLG